MSLLAHSQLSQQGQSNDGKILMTGRKQMSLLHQGKEGESRELTTGKPSISPWEGNGANPPGNRFQIHEEKGSWKQ